MRVWMLSIALLAASSNWAVADDPSIYVGDNHSWIASCNASGYRLTSKYPVSRYVEAGVNSRSTEAIETIYLGKACDAQHKVLGKGKWCQANGGFTADFENGASIGFPRQELACPSGNYNFQSCGC